MNRRNRQIFHVLGPCFFLLFLVQQPLAAPVDNRLPEGIFVYRESTGDQAALFEWRAEERQEGIVIWGLEKSKTFFNLCGPDGATRKWRYSEPGKNEITARRIGNSLAIRGTRYGKEITKTVALDDRPWYQPLSFSLGKFLSSTEAQTSFWIIRADKIEVVAMTAEKVGEETLFFENGEVDAHKVEIRAEGFLAKMWHGTYWYRKSDNFFLRYQSVHGLPGSAMTTVELVSTLPKS
jgi:hypothetical protein